MNCTYLSPCLYTGTGQWAGHTEDWEIQSGRTGMLCSPRWRIRSVPAGTSRNVGQSLRDYNYLGIVTRDLGKTYAKTNVWPRSNGKRTCPILWQWEFESCWNQRFLFWIECENNKNKWKSGRGWPNKNIFICLNLSTRNSTKLHFKQPFKGIIRLKWVIFKILQSVVKIISF